MIHWGSVVARIRECHKRQGLSLVSPQGVYAWPPGSYFVNLSGSGDTLGPDPILGKRRIGHWLFSNREKRQIRRQNSLVWTAYDSEQKQNFIGFGAVVSETSALRLKARGLETLPLQGLKI